MRAVASRSSATMCTTAAGITIHGVQSWSARTARLFARKLSACVGGARPERTKTQNVVRRPPSFSPQAGTGPDRFLGRPGPVLTGIGGRVGELAFIATWIPVGGVGVLRNS